MPEFNKPHWFPTVDEKGWNQCLIYFYLSVWFFPVLRVQLWLRVHLKPSILCHYCKWCRFKYHSRRAGRNNDTDNYLRQDQTLHRSSRRFGKMWYATVSIASDSRRKQISSWWIYDSVGDQDKNCLRGRSRSEQLRCVDVNKYQHSNSDTAEM